MTIANMAPVPSTLITSAPSAHSAIDDLIGPGGAEAFRAGFIAILADAAREHLQAGDVDKATLCLQEAERCLSQGFST